MKARFHKTTWRAVSGIAASFVLVVSFQNCGKAGFDSELDGELDLSSDAALTAKYGTSTAAKVSDIPFAFDAGIDTISYNSCAFSTLKNKEQYFTLKAGTYSSGGIKLKDTFFDYVNQNFSPIYPATALSTIQYKELLSDSPANSGVSPNLAVRVKNSLTDVYYKDNSLTLQTDIIPLVGVMTDPLVMDSFINKGVTASYFPFSPEMKIMEGSFTRNDSEAMAMSFRELLSGNAAALSLTFTPPNEEIYKISAPSTTYPVKTAYGKGYSMEFSTYPGSNAAANSRVISAVRENDLSSPTTSSKYWGRCRSYKIVRAADALIAGNSYCPNHTQAELANVTIRTELEIARRHFRADQWDINVQYGCAVPKSTSCYEEKQYAGAPIVNYDVTQACRTGIGDDGTQTLNSQCLHYLSICTR